MESLENFPLNVPCHSPSLSRLLYLLVGQLLGADRNEISIGQPEFIEQSIERLDPMVAGFGVFHRFNNIAPCFQKAIR